MNVPDSIARVYEEELAIVTPLQERASSRLRIIAADNSWLFDDRIKSIDSALSKLEAGSTTMRDMHDFYAAMLVVPTRKHVQEAIEAVLGRFNAIVKPPREHAVESFVYDDAHIIAKLEGVVSPRSVPHPAVLERAFEIQIHTGAQYAWWRATHDEIYKGSNLASRSWAARRAAGQARASLELVDGVLADFEAAAHLQRLGPDSNDPTNEAREWLRFWPPRARPSDQVRFASTSASILAASAVEFSSVTALFEAGDLDTFVRSVTVTPVQVVLIACHLIAGDQIFDGFRSNRIRVLVTEELIAEYPQIDSPRLVARVEI